jgi:hypothetical protein
LALAKVADSGRPLAPDRFFLLGHERREPLPPFVRIGTKVCEHPIE